MALTPQQIAQMDKVTGLGQSQPAQSSQPSLLGSLGNLGMNATRDVSDLARNLGLGAVPDILGSAGLGLQEAYQGKNPLQGVPFVNQLGSAPNAQQLQKMTSANPFMSPTDAQNVGGLKNAVQDEAGAGGWLTGGLTGTATPLLARAGIGAVSGGLMGLSNPQIKTRGDALTNAGAGAIAGGVANAILPPALKGLSNWLTSLSYGKAGQAIPAITEETGKDITGLESKGAKSAVQNIGQKIGNIYQGLGAKDQGLAKNELMNLVSDSGNLTKTGISNSPLDELINKMNLNDPATISEAKDYIAPSFRLVNKGLQRGGVSFQGDFLESLNNYLDKNPELQNYIEQNGGIQNIDKMSLPTSFWAQLSSDLNSKVPYDKITNAETGMKDFSKLGGRQSMQAQLANVIKQQVQDNVGIADPQKLNDLERLNGLYGSAKSIASGKAKGVINSAMMARYGLMVPAALGISAYTNKNTTLSPFLAGASALSLLANPSVSGPIASGVGSAGVRAAIPALSAILGSRQAQALFGGQQQ